MACHLSHKLPWGQLLEIYVRHKTVISCRSTGCSPKVARFLEYFAKNFIQQLQDFRASDKSTNDEIRDIDAKGWGDWEFTMNGTWMGYYDSLFWGYLELNLLLMDPKRVAPLMMPDGRLSFALSVIGEYANGSHPDHIAGPLREALKDPNRDFSSPAMMKVMRDHAALLFRCMYSITGRNKLLETNTTEMLVFGFFGWQIQAIRAWQERK